MLAAPSSSQRGATGDASPHHVEPLVTVVVVTWNGAHLLPGCLASLRAQTLSADLVRVVVVDNASEDETSDLLVREHPDVDVLVSEYNRGFAGGANLGLRAATTPYVVVLNNDATAEPDLLAAFVHTLEAVGHEQVGAVTGKVLLEHDGMLNSTGNLVARTGRGYDRDWRRPDDGTRPAGEVFGFCGAAAALRTAALDQVGLFDESLFLYYEDTDLSWRLRAAGWSVLYEPSAVARHRHASSSREGSARFHYWNERNSMVVFSRHAPLALVARMLVRRAVGLAVHTVRDGVTDEVTRARWRAIGAYLRRLPRTVHERHETWRHARSGRAEVAALLSPRPGA